MSDPIAAALLPPTLDRRDVLKGGLVAVTALVAGCTPPAAAPGPTADAGSLLDAGAGAVADAGVVADAGATVVVPVPQGAYRHQQRVLFQRTDRFSEPSRLPNGTPLEREAGPTARFVSVSLGPDATVPTWPWDHLGGDFLDADLVRQGPKAWASVALGGASGATASADYAVDCTALVKHAQQQDRWLALLVKVDGSPRALAGRFGPGGLPDNVHAPVMAVVYADGAAAELPCLITAYAGTATAMPTTTKPDLNFPAFLEFERPAGAVQEATLRFRCTQHYSGPVPKADVFLVDPPVRSTDVRLGVAAGAKLDAGLAADPSIIGVHRYLDGTAFEDFCHTGPGPAGPNWNVGAERDFDPAIYGNGPTDLTRLPHVGLGKWINAGATRTFSLISSSFREDGFEPLVPGMGALRITMPQEALQDGDVVGYGGTLGANAKIFMPEPLFGRLQRIFVRQYFRIGVVGGGPYVCPFASNLQVKHSASDPTLLWTGSGGGKGLVMPAHDTSYGGVTGSSGGGHGWQMRNGWHDNDRNVDGPDEGGWSLYPHWFDFQTNNPVGHRYGGGNEPVGGLYPQGGLGSMAYAHRWYCFESELSLNTLTTAAPGYLADGALRQWIDGRLCYEATGVVMRSSPLINVAADPLKLRPARELGIRDLWFNWFHGGTLKNARPRVMFLTGLAWGHQYIGPMAM